MFLSLSRNASSTIYLLWWLHRNHKKCLFVTCVKLFRDKIWNHHIFFFFFDLTEPLRVINNKNIGKQTAFKSICANSLHCCRLCCSQPTHLTTLLPFLNIIIINNKQQFSKKKWKNCRLHFHSIFIIYSTQVTSIQRKFAWKFHQKMRGSGFFSILNLQFSYGIGIHYALVWWTMKVIFE